MKIAPLLFAIALLGGLSALRARDIYVDPQTGDEHNNGAAAKSNGADGPLKTIAAAIKQAKPGDTVHLAPLVFKEVAIFNNRSGEPGKPIVLDGHSATLDGCDPLNPDDWPEVSPGLFRNDHLLRIDDSVIQRWFFLWDGKMNHMGRSSKGLRPPLKKPEELQPGEWTFVKDESRQPPTGSQQYFGSFYVKLPPGQKLADAHIEAPVRSAGVQFSGTNKWITVRNVTGAHVYNDGFNIHGSCRDCVFENIRAFECGDDGISSHDDCQVRVENFVSIANSTGIADAGDSLTEYNHVFIRDCLGVDLLFMGSNRHAIHNAVVLSNAHSVLALSNVSGPDTGTCTLALDNVFIRREKAPVPGLVGKGGVLDLQHVTMLGCDLQATEGEVTLHDTIFAVAPDKNGLYPSGRGAKAAQLLKDLSPK